MPNMQLNNIDRPAADNEMDVVRAGQSSAVPVGNLGPIYPNDAIIAAADCVAATLQNTDNSDATIFTMSGDDPPTIEVNWDEVTQVDEYYNEGTGGYDYWITTTDEIQVIVRG